jgi:putative MATE family efflux protein
MIVILGFPLLIGGFSSYIAGITDTIMMGHYSPAALAAVSASSAIFDIFAAVVLASITGHQILTARFAGRQDPSGIRMSLRSSAVFCGGLALLLTLLCVLFGGQLTSLVTGGSPRLADIGAAYLLARGPTLLLLVPFTLLIAIFNAYGRPRYALCAGIVVGAVNLLLDWLLIFGPGPFPRLGAFGNGLATTLSWVLGVGCVLLAARKFGLAALLTSKGTGARPDFTTSIPKLSWPMIVSALLDYASMAVFFWVLGGLGAAALAGGRIAFEIMVLIFAVGSSFAAAGRILIGRAIGADDLVRSKQLWRVSQLILLAPALLLGGWLVVFPGPIVQLFTGFASAAAAAGRALPLIGCALPLMAWALGNTSMLRAAGMTRWDMYGNLIAAICVQLPVAWLLAHVGGFGVVGAYGGVLCYWLCRAVMTDVLGRVTVRRAMRPSEMRIVTAPGRIDAGAAGAAGRPR